MLSNKTDCMFETVRDNIIDILKAANFNCYRISGMNMIIRDLRVYTDNLCCYISFGDDYLNISRHFLTPNKDSCTIYYCDPDLFDSVIDTVKNLLA